MRDTTILSWSGWESFSTLKEKENFHDLTVPMEYKKIWKEVSMAVQHKKALQHGLSESDMLACFSQLIKRPYFLTLLADKHGCENIAEIGTAEGLQFYTFAHYVANKKGHVWSCDLRDVRNKTYADKYNNETTFYLKNSGELAKLIKAENKKIDFFYIDASHEKGAVLADVENMKKVQSDNPVWVFDDFDERFGCFDDIKSLCMQNKNFQVYRVGNAASGNPNHQVVIVGKL
jgi:predicted O-methyltransferase YrrM